MRGQFKLSGVLMGELATTPASILSGLILFSATLTPALGEVSDFRNGVIVAADEPHLPDAAPSVGPLRRGADGKIEIIDPDKDRGTAAPGDAPGTSPRAADDSISAFHSGHWVEVPNSNLAAIIYNGPLADQLEGNSGRGSIMTAWSGGTFDRASDSLIVWGGGHQDYYGNAVYAFSLKTLSWKMLSRPSSIAGWSRTTPILPDGTPSAQHTYDALTMLPSGQMFVAGSAGATPNGYSYAESWLFDPATGKWQQAAPFRGASIDQIAEYDAASGMVFALDSGSALQSYDPATNRWTRIGSQKLADYHMTGAIDPVDRILVTVGNGFLQSISLTTGSVVSITSSGDRTAQNGNAPGFVWDSSANLFVAWNGGSTLYTLDPRRWRWTAHAADAENKVTPTAPASNGTFGRFQYKAADDLFILVNDINQNVYLYKRR